MYPDCTVLQKGRLIWEGIVHNLTKRVDGRYSETQFHHFLPSPKAAEVGIYKRKQESKKKRTRPRKRSRKKENKNLTKKARKRSRQKEKTFLFS